jgi:hypothetical protein
MENVDELLAELEAIIQRNMELIARTNLIIKENHHEKISMA